MRRAPAANALQTRAPSPTMPTLPQVTFGLMSPGTRRAVLAMEGEVWRARAVRPGHRGDGRLMAEHSVGPVRLRDCECPQPAFVDCAKPPFKGPRPFSDPVVFDNAAGVPLDLYYWNGTCEELVSWHLIGGVQARETTPRLRWRASPRARSRPPPLCRSPAYACRSSRRRGTPCARAPRAPTGDS